MPKLEQRIHKQIPSSKIKLQLFPINENTRLGLEKDGYNPFLELTLSAQKKISSVVRHLNTKWGSSSAAVGQLMLFPYAANLKQLPSCRRWTSNDNAITAWDVYVAVKTPFLFRLRYGWFSSHQLEMLDIHPKSGPLEAHIDSVGKSQACGRVLDIQNQEEKLDVGHEASERPQEEMDTNKTLLSDVKEPKPFGLPSDRVDNEVSTDIIPLQSTVPWDDCLTNLSIGGLLSEISLLGKINGSDVNAVKDSSMQTTGLISDISVGGLLSEASLQGKISDPDTKSENKSTLQPILLTSSDISIGGLLSEASLLSNKRKLDTQSVEGELAQLQPPWYDSLTTLSIGGLLSEASLQTNAGCKMEVKESKSNLQRNAPLSESFDAFITAQLNADSQVIKPTCHEPSLSILDAEDTCHAFPFQKVQPSSRDALSSDLKASAKGCGSSTNSTLFRFPKVAKVNNDTGLANDFSGQELKTNPLPRALGGAIDEDSSIGLSGVNQLSGPSQHLIGSGGDSTSVS